MSTPELTKSEAEVWDAWKRAAEAVLSRVGRDISDGTGLSGADFGVLSRLVDLGQGELRQQELADAMGWDKSRLSHHLTRMVERALITRKKSAGTVMVAVTAAGKRVLKSARPVHARAVRSAFLERIPSGARREILGILAAIGAGDGE